jgi:hypothetical protein
MLFMTDSFLILNIFFILNLKLCSDLFPTVKGILIRGEKKIPV